MLRRAIGTTLVGLCALTGPLSTGAFATDVGPGLTLDGVSSGGIRPGVAFDLVGDEGCPTDSGVQQVVFTFIDRSDHEFPLGAIDTEDDGSWSSASVMLPVAGLGPDGWARPPIARGTGEVTATCYVAADPGDDPSDPGDDPSDPGDDPSDPGDEDPATASTLPGGGPSGPGTTDPSGDDPGENGDGTDDPIDDPTDPGDPGDDPNDPGDDPNDPGDGEPVETLSYESAELTVSGPAAKLVLSQPGALPGGSVTVTPAGGCATGTGSTVTVTVVTLTAPEEGGDPVDLPTATATSSATGVWSPVTLSLPATIPTGDYAVTAECAADDIVTSRYDAEPLALGTVLIGAAVCSPRDTRIPVTGTYDGAIALRRQDSRQLPATLTLRGNGPWDVTVRSAVTGQILAAKKVDCDKPQFDLDVPRTELTRDGKVRARVCNTGRAPVTAVLQLLRNKRFQQVDQEKLEAGKCSWLEGPKVKRGSTARARVWIDAPGSDSDEASESFRLKRGRH